MLRFARPHCYQGYPDALLPPELRNANPLGIQRLVDGRLTRDAICRETLDPGACQLHHAVIGWLRLMSRSKSSG